jgi:type IV pilus assembly protein PilC
VPRYIYEAVSQAGEKISSEIEAGSVLDAIGQLEGRGWNIQSIRAVVDVPATAHVVAGAAFLERIEASLAQRDTLIPALEALAAETTSGGAARDMRELISKLKQGAGASEFMQHGSAASWLPLLMRGVSSESGGSGFLRFMSHAVRESENRSNRRRSLIYPLTVLAVSLALIVILLITVVPTFGKMFS